MGYAAGGAASRNKEKHSVELPLSSSSGYTLYTTAVVSTFYCICTGVSVRLRGVQILSRQACLYLGGKVYLGHSTSLDVEVRSASPTKGKGNASNEQDIVFPLSTKLFVQTSTCSCCRKRTEILSNMQKKKNMKDIGID